MAEPMVRPFAGLTTPRSLEARRRAESQARYANEGFWVQRAAEHGQDLKAEFARLGYGLDDEDIRAQAHEKLLVSVMQDAKLAIDAGELSPDEAQGYIMQTAMTALLDAGDYEAANEIAPQLTEWQKGRLALDKIRSEIGKEQSQAYQAQATGTRQLTDARRLAARTPEEVALLQEQQETQRSIQEKNRRIDPAKPAEGPEDPADFWRTYKPTASAADKFAQQFPNTITAFQKMTGLYQHVLQAPGIGSRSAARIAASLDEAIGIGKLFRSVGDKDDLAANASVEARALTEKLSEKELKQELRRRRLNVDYKDYRSRVMDLAYSLAKAADPGGRLSNADIDNALEIIGSSGDPQAQAVVLRRVMEDTYKRLMNAKSMGPVYAAHPGFATVDEEYKKFLDVVSANAKQPARAPSKPGSRPAMTDEELLRKYGGGD